MLAGGTAFAGGSLPSSGRAFDHVGDGGGKLYSGTNTKLKEELAKASSSSSSSSSSGSSSGSSDSADEFKEKIDWIEIAIDRIDRAISRLDLKATSVFNKWSDRNSALAGEMDEIRLLIEAQEAAAARYQQEADSLGLSSEWVEKIKNGTIDISTITDEKLKEKIDEYMEWHEKSLDSLEAAEQARKDLSSKYVERFENVIKEYDGILSIIEAEKNLLDEFINQSEAQGWLVSANYYHALIQNEQENLAQLEAKRDDLIAEFNDAIKNGGIDETSEQWIEFCNSINEATLAIEESNTQLLEYQQTLQELDWEVFEVLQDRISKVTDEAEFLIELLDSDKLYIEEGKGAGQLTDAGMATMGLQGVKYNVAMARADQYAEKVAELKKKLAEDPYNQDLRDLYDEAVSGWQDMISSAQDAGEAIRDMVEEGINLELEALQELIDKRNEALDTEKEAYDYQKKVKEQTKEIAQLEKQMAAYRNDTSEENKARIQELKISLEEAEQELEETEYDKYISDQEKLMDDLYLEYETILNERLDNLELLITDMVAEINDNSSTIAETLSEKAESVGYDLSQSMTAIWDVSANKITGASGEIKNVITTYGDNFKNAWTTTNSALRDISVNISNMIKQLNKIAGTKVESSQSVAGNEAVKAKNAENDKKNNSNKTTSSGDGTPKIGDRVKFISGQYYYDSSGKSPIGSKYKGQEVYITNIRPNSSHPYHVSTGSKLGSGDLGWLKLSQISGYATGKKKFLSDETAWTQENGSEFIVRPSDGAILTPLAKNDSVLSAAASSNLWSMANSPADFIKDNLGLGNINASAGSGGTTYVTQNFEKIVFSMPDVKNYDEMLSQMQKDPNFDRLVKAMTFDQMAGKSSMRKGKSIR